MSIAQEGPSSREVVIHFAESFPVVRTLCGLTRAPATDDWKHVTCPKCLEQLGPGQDRDDA